MFISVLCCELKIVFRKGVEIVNLFWFFLIVIILFLLGIGLEL